MSGAISLQAATGPPVRAVSMRVLIPFVGVWLAELELDPLQVAMAPTSGPVTITVGDPVPLFTMVGTVDPRGSGAFVETAQVRVLGGAAGWDQPVPRLDFQSDGGLTTSQVYPPTGAAVGELVNVVTPLPLGRTHYMRVAGPARSVFEREGETWWLDMAGVTQVGPRLPAVPDASVTLIHWDPLMQVADLTSDVLVIPGTVITDPRLVSGPVTVRDVEQVFDQKGSKVTAWCGLSPVAQLMNDLRSLVEQFSGRAYLRTYLYRIVSQNSIDGRLQLQAVHSDKGAPDTLPVQPWPGASGDSAKYKPGSQVRVAFLEGDPGQPIVDLYDPTAIPLERTVDASTATHIGPSSISVDLAGGKVPVALATPLVTVLNALATWATAVSGALGSAGFPIGGATSTLLTALGTGDQTIPATKVTGI